MQVQSLIGISAILTDAFTQKWTVIMHSPPCDEKPRGGFVVRNTFQELRSTTALQRSSEQLR